MKKEAIYGLLAGTAAGVGIGVATGSPMLGLGVGSAVSGGVLSGLGGTEQTAGASREEIMDAIRKARESGLLEIHAAGNEAYGALASMLAGSGAVDSGLAASGISRVAGQQMRAMAGMESNLAQMFLQALAQQQFQPVPTNTSIIGSMLSQTSGPLVSFGLKSLMQHDYAADEAKAQKSDQEFRKELAKMYDTGQAASAANTSERKDFFKSLSSQRSDKALTGRTHNPDAL